MPGTTTLAAEVTHISRHGFGVLLGEEELLLPFAQFPWFKQATVEQITHVEHPAPSVLFRRGCGILIESAEKGIV